MQTRMRRGIAGIVRATVVSVVVLGVFGARPASAEEIGNMIAFKAGSCGWTVTDPMRCSLMPEILSAPV